MPLPPGQPNAAQALAGAAERLQQREHQAQRGYHAKLARPTYWAWLEQGGVHGKQPLPKPVRGYLKRYGTGALEDLAP
jgi:hypothetical protein